MARVLFDRRSNRAASHSSRQTLTIVEPALLDTLEPRCLMSATPGVPVLWSGALGGNGNSYEIIIAGSTGISWEDARLAAESRGGHLATITSQAENDFIFSLIDDPQFWQRLNTLGIQAHGPWIGAFKPAGNASMPAAQGWQWVSGEAFNFTSWAVGQPDRATEHYVHFGARGQLTDDVWNNWVNHSSTLPVISYIVEYEAPPAPPANEEPVFADLLPALATEGTAFSFVISATDADGDALAISADALPDWLTLTDHGDGTATLSGTPGYAHLGSLDITLEVSDGQHTVQRSLSLEVQSIGDITGTLFHDADRDGVRDEGEAALAGWTVYIDANANGKIDDGENATVSLADGSYHLHSVAPGEHLVRIAAPVDLTLLDRFQLLYLKGKSKTLADFSDAAHFRQTWVDSRTLMLEFESGDDAAFDEMKLAVKFDESGKVTLDVESHDRKACFFMLDSSARFSLRPLALGRHSLRDAVKIEKAWKHTTPKVVSVTTEAEGLVTDIHFGLTQPRFSFHHRRWCR